MTAAVMAVLSTGSAPALAALACPHYVRELQAQQLPGGLIAVQIEKRGFRRYKRRWPLPSYPPPPADVEGIKQAFAAAGLPIREVTDHGEYVIVTFGGAK